ncbi:hypothetical protein RDI58_000990 [Solanum bulbocastanum]|uniref:Reverse transcriptase zinc-binding domain-containing protein n=1 Tax=Solanum bulbocastanum TaxID=147425 RepID=A0AAN8YPQ9_SOLBU
MLKKDDKGKEKESIKKWVEEAFCKQGKDRELSKVEGNQNVKSGEWSKEKNQPKREGVTKNMVEKVTDITNNSQNFTGTGNSEKQEILGASEVKNDKSMKENKTPDLGTETSNNMESEGSLTNRHESEQIEKHEHTLGKSHDEEVSETNEVNRGEVEEDDIQENIKEISAKEDLSPRHTKELRTGRKHINTEKNFRMSSDSLWSHYMWNKYYKKKHPVIAQGSGISHIWRKMIQIREEVEHNIWWQIRNGEESFWFDDWTKQGALYYLEEQNHSDKEIEVKEFTKEGGWDKGKLNQYVSEEMVQYIIENISPILVETGRDKAWWMGNTSGSFTVNLAWELLRHRRGEMEILKFIWNKQIPFKINFFLWRVYKRRVLTDDNL